MLKSIKTFSAVNNFYIQSPNISKLRFKESAKCLLRKIFPALLSLKEKKYMFIFLFRIFFRNMLCFARNKQMKHFLFVRVNSFLYFPEVTLC